MRLVQLEYFIKIAECGSITKAAQELYVSQPSLTKAIASLEAEYDIKLLERTSKGVRIPGICKRCYQFQSETGGCIWQKRFRSDPEALYCQPTV